MKALIYPKKSTRGYHVLIKIWVVANDHSWITCGFLKKGKEMTEEEVRRFIPRYIKYRKDLDIKVDLSALAKEVIEMTPKDNIVFGDGRLPNGTVTDDYEEYIQTWEDFAAPICEAVNLEVIAFDPGVSFRVRDVYHPHAQSIQLPSWFIRRINSVLGGKSDDPRR